VGADVGGRTGSAGLWNLFPPDGPITAPARETLMGNPITPEETRADFWRWFAFDGFERLDMNLVNDDQFDAIEDAARLLLVALCDAVGHKLRDDAFGACVFCNRSLDGLLAAESGSTDG